jgi:hypothetical protein
LAHAAFGSDDHGAVSWVWEKHRKHMIGDLHETPRKTSKFVFAKSQDMTRDANKKIKKTPAQNEPDADGYSGEKIDRPGFDLSGSSDDTHAGTGLGLGNNAFEASGDRRLPGRRLDNKLTIPRWGGPEPDGPTKPSSKSARRKT